MGAESADTAVALVSRVLRGPEHPTLGDHTAEAVGQQAALGLSAGRYPKAVPAVDGNEDAATVTTGPGGTVLAVADGHFGADAAVAAIDVIAAGARDLVASQVADPRNAITDLARAAADAVGDARAQASGQRRDSATALAIVLVVHRSLWVITFGDVAVVRTRGNRPRVLSRASPFLIGGGATLKPRRDRLRPGDHVMVVSDGVVDHLGRSWPDELTLRARGAASPAAAVESILLGAMDGGAGDHLACAVARHR